MSVKHISGCGRLLLTRATGLEYEAHYGIELLVDTPRRGRGSQLSRWGKCSFRSAHAQRITEGRYFLHAEDGRIHQVKSVDGEWRYLALTARSNFADPRKSSDRPSIRTS
jgi:hypothetical protein